MTQPTAPAPSTAPPSIPGTRRRRIATAPALAGGMPSSTPPAVTTEVVAKNPAPVGVGDPPTVPTELLDQEEPIDEAELELGSSANVAGAVDTPAVADAVQPPSPPPVEGRRRGRPPRAAGATAAPVAAPAPVQVAAAPTDDELRALGALMLLARRLGEPLEQVVTKVRAMISAYDKFGG